MNRVMATGYGMDRRGLLQGLTALVGAAAFPDFARAMVKGGGPGLEVLHPVFTVRQRALVAALSERIMPTTDTPGAIVAGVPAFIEMMLGDWFEPVQKAQFLADLNALEAYTASQHKAPFAKLGADRQDAILTAAMNKAVPGVAQDFFERLRTLVISGYFRSEIGATVERFYLPVPGEYIGDYPYTKVGRVISS